MTNNMQEKGRSTDAKKRVALIYSSYYAPVKMYYTRWPDQFSDPYLSVKPYSLVATNHRQAPDNAFYYEGKKNFLQRTIRFYNSNQSSARDWWNDQNDYKPLRKIKLWSQIGGLIAYEPDVVHLVNSSAYLKYSKVFKKKYPKLVASFHGFDIVTRPDIDAVWKEALLELFNCADCLHFVSQWLCEAAKKLGAPQEKTRVIYAGVDYDFYTPGKKIKRIDPKNKISILSTGRLVRLKGYEYILPAIRCLLDEGFDLDYSIIGGGEDLSRLTQIATDLNIKERVHFLGRKNQIEVKQLIGCADIYVHPSTTEALGVAILEVCSMGLPVIASSVGGIPEIIQNGENGILVEPEQSSPLTDAIRMLIQNNELARELGKKARESVITKFSIQQETKNWRELYQDL